MEVDDLIPAIGRAGVFAGTGGGSPFGGFLTDFWYDGDTYMDLSVEPNRRDFIDAAGKPVELSGSPHLQLRNPVASWFDNVGSANDLTESDGTLVEAASGPSD